MNSIQEDRWAVIDMVTMFESEDISIPIGQRMWAWKNKRGTTKMRNLVDSVINKFPIPTCILNRTGGRKFEVYDGRHRIETLFRYTKDEFTWNEKKYSELSLIEKTAFDSREIPVTIIRNATPAQLAEMFIRLNAGIPLKDYDLLWANRNSPLLHAVDRFVRKNDRLSAALGNLDMTRREDLANWTALVCGLSTQNTGNMTTSYIRICSDVGLDHIPKSQHIQEGLDSICLLLETANEKYPADDKSKRTLKKVGKVIAFFVTDWLQSESKTKIIEKWVSVIGRLRGSKAGDMLAALSTTGAQNLTSQKISIILDKVNEHLERGVVYSDLDESDGESQ